MFFYHFSVVGLILPVHLISSTLCRLDGNQPVFVFMVQWRKFFFSRFHEFILSCQSFGENESVCFTKRFAAAYQRDSWTWGHVSSRGLNEGREIFCDGKILSKNYQAFLTQLCSQISNLSTMKSSLVGFYLFILKKVYCLVWSCCSLVKVRWRFVTKWLNDFCVHSAVLLIFNVFGMEAMLLYKHFVVRVSLGLIEARVVDFHNEYSLIKQICTFINWICLWSFIHLQFLLSGERWEVLTSEMTALTTSPLCHVLLKP